MLELYHWEPNTYFLKPLIALHEKGIPFTSHWFDPTALEQFAPGFPRDTESTLQLEREGPLLVHDGRLISSTFFMLEYIATGFPGADLFPGDAFQHYRIRSWGQVLTGMGADVSIIGCAQYLIPRVAASAVLRSQLERIEPLERRLAWSTLLDGTYDAKALAAIRQRLKGSLQRIETALGKSAWLAGADYSIADIDAFSFIASLPTLAPDLLNEQATPRLADFLRRMHQRDAVKAALSHTRSGRPFEAFVPGAEPSRWG